MIILIYFKQGIGYSFIQKKQITLTLSNTISPNHIDVQYVLDTTVVPLGHY